MGLAGGALSSPAGPGGALPLNDIWCLGAEKIASGENNFSAVHEIIASAHEPKRFDGENYKAKSNIYGCSAPT